MDRPYLPSATAPRVSAERALRSRRAFLQRSGALGAGMFLAGCAATATAGERPLSGATNLNVVNWAEYIDLGSLDQIRVDTGLITLDYREEYVDNVSGFNEIIEPQLREGGTPDFDIIIPTQWLSLIHI